jgi:hypothetical protein
MMDPVRRQVLLVAGKALLLLPFLLAAWYAAAGPLAYVPGKFALPIIRLVSDGLTSMALKERDLVYTIKLEMPYRPGVTPRVAADIDVSAAKFTYGIALFLALCLAAKQSRHPVGIAIGCAILLVTPAIGIAFDALVQLGATPGMEGFLRWSGGTREGVALGYQLGTLLVPTLAPVAIWLVLVRPLWAPVFAPAEIGT